MIVSNETNYGEAQMTESEFLQLTLQLAQLRAGTEYQKAFRLVRRNRPEQMARADKNSEEYAAIRLLIGTWEGIAIIGNGFSAAQRKRFFRCHPVLLLWRLLEPAAKVIRSETDKRFAKEFEDLAMSYRVWTESKDGQEFRTAEQQAICARFA
jgi:hypothetical protein